jgi:hypothetical protein
MIWVIEFRNGFYLQSLEVDNSGPLVTAKRFDSESEANQLISKHPWIAVNGGFPQLVRASRYLDLELAARVILRTLPPGSLSAPPSAVKLLEKKLLDIAQAIWTQGWDCREEQGALAGAFGHANRYNPYRRPEPQRKCCRCGASPLRTERGRCEDCGDCLGCGDDDCHRCQEENAAAIKGSESIAEDAVSLLIFSGQDITREELAVSVEKLRDAPIPNLEPRVTFEPPADRGKGST